MAEFSPHGDRFDLGAGRRLEDYLGKGVAPSLLVRCDFSDNSAWRKTATTASATAPSGLHDEPQFRANLTCIDNPEYDGFTPAQAVQVVDGGPPFFVFLADFVTMINREHPLLAVNTGGPEFGRPGQTFRIIPTVVWSAENNLSLANMSFQDFVDTVDNDGIHRGLDAVTLTAASPQYRRQVVLTKGELEQSIERITPTAELRQFAAELVEQNIDAVRFTAADAAAVRSYAAGLDFSTARILIGHDAYLRACSVPGDILVGSVIVGRAQWWLVADDTTHLLLAAMKYVP